MAVAVDRLHAGAAAGRAGGAVVEVLLLPLLLLLVLLRGSGSIACSGSSIAPSSAATSCIVRRASVAAAVNLPISFVLADPSVIIVAPPPRRLQQIVAEVARGVEFHDKAQVACVDAALLSVGERCCCDACGGGGAGGGLLGGLALGLGVLVLSESVGCRGRGGPVRRGAYDKRGRRRGSVWRRRCTTTISVSVSIVVVADAVKGRWAGLQRGGIRHQISPKFIVHKHIKQSDNIRMALDRVDRLALLDSLEAVPIILANEVFHRKRHAV